MVVESEIDALKAVDEALGAIDEDARMRVLNWANSKYSSTSMVATQVVNAVQEEQPPAAKPSTIPNRKAAKANKPKTKPTKKPKTVYKQVKELNLRPSGNQSARDFVAEKNPTNQKQKCVVALYYLLHVLDLKKAGIDHIYTLFKDCSWPVPANLPNTLHQAGTSGWLDTADAGDIKITPMGENVVEHDLPKKKKQG